MLVMVANHLAPCPPLHPNPLSDDASYVSSSPSCLLSPSPSYPSPFFSLSLSPSPFSPPPHSIPLSHRLRRLHPSPTAQNPTLSLSPTSSLPQTLLTSLPHPPVPYRLVPLPPPSHLATSDTSPR